MFFIFKYGLVKLNDWLIPPFHAATLSQAMFIQHKLSSPGVLTVCSDCDYSGMLVSGLLEIPSVFFDLKKSIYSSDNVFSRAEGLIDWYSAHSQREVGHKTL